GAVRHVASGGPACVRRTSQAHLGPVLRDGRACRDAERARHASTKHAYFTKIMRFFPGSTIVFLCCCGPLDSGRVRQLGRDSRFGLYMDPLCSRPPDTLDPPPPLASPRTNRGPEPAAAGAHPSL